ncbi:hypothetical protein [Dehalococcoides mccartyi]|uniref:hypothetical protein n=1 Tax=Dehalococcoides mccartyi TaxID=61435 RepID=UPI00107EC712|nr:hypothetical protein [Dehalococcoides mccartyi]QBX64099.1 hypothetical protein DhcFL2_04900 [Dehalococcoides mccartyi]
MPNTTPDGMPLGLITPDTMILSSGLPKVIPDAIPDGKMFWLSLAIPKTSVEAIPLGAILNPPNDMIGAPMPKVLAIPEGRMFRFRLTVPKIRPAEIPEGTMFWFNFAVPKARVGAIADGEMVAAEVAPVP